MLGQIGFVTILYFFYKTRPKSGFPLGINKKLNESLYKNKSIINESSEDIPYFPAYDKPSLGLRISLFFLAAVFLLVPLTDIVFC